MRRPVNGFGGVGAIPYVEIQAYLDLISSITDHEDRQLFIELVEHLDSHFLKDVLEKQQAERKKADSAAKRKK